VEKIASRIFVLQGQRVMLDADLADIYGVTTKASKPQGQTTFSAAHLEQLARSHLENPLSPSFGGEVRRNEEQGPHLLGMRPCRRT